MSLWTGAPLSSYAVAVATAIHLDGSLKEFYGNVMLPLQTEAVSSYTPGLQTGGGRERKGGGGSVCEYDAGGVLGWGRLGSGLASGQFLSMSVRSLDRADSATSFCRCHSVVE